MHLRGKFGDFVQKQGAAVGEFKTPDALGGRSGERSFGVPEKFAFEQGLGQRRTVHADKRRVLALAAAVNILGQQIFARACLAQEQQGDVESGRDAHPPHDVAHGFAVADDPFLAYGEGQGLGLHGQWAKRRLFQRKDSPETDRDHRTQFQQKGSDLVEVVGLFGKGAVQGGDDFVVEHQGEGHGGGKPGLRDGMHEGSGEILPEVGDDHRLARGDDAPGHGAGRFRRAHRREGAHHGALGGREIGEHFSLLVVQVDAQAVKREALLQKPRQGAEKSLRRAPEDRVLQSWRLISSICLFSWPSGLVMARSRRFAFRRPGHDDHIWVFCPYLGGIFRSRRRTDARFFSNPFVFLGMEIQTLFGTCFAFPFRVPPAGRV